MSLASDWDMIVFLRRFDSHCTAEMFRRQVVKPESPGTAVPGLSDGVTLRFKLPLSPAPAACRPLASRSPPGCGWRGRTGRCRRGTISAVNGEYFIGLKTPVAGNSASATPRNWNIFLHNPRVGRLQRRVECSFPIGRRRDAADRDPLPAATAVGFHHQIGLSSADELNQFN